MPTFTAICKYTVTQYLEVEADDEKAAERKARKDFHLFYSSENDDDYGTLDDVEIEETP